MSTFISLILISSSNVIVFGFIQLSSTLDVSTLTNIDRFQCSKFYTVVSIPIIHTHTVVSIPIIYTHTVVSNPIQLFQFLYSCINSYTVVSTPLQLYQFLYSCIKSYGLKSCTVHYRIPEKEWSFQDGGRASLFKVGLVV